MMVNSLCSKIIELSENVYVHFLVLNCLSVPVLNIKWFLLQGSRVHINEDGELVWPVMLLYPEYHETDLIQEFTESNW